MIENIASNIQKIYFLIKTKGMFYTNKTKKNDIIFYVFLITGNFEWWMIVDYWLLSWSNGKVLILSLHQQNIFKPFSFKVQNPFHLRYKRATVKLTNKNHCEIISFLTWNRTFAPPKMKIVSKAIAFIATVAIFNARKYPQRFW